MRIIIVGAGVIGANLAQSLSEENHIVFLIENDEQVAQRISDKLDVKVITGNGADPDTLKQIDIEQADLVIAVTTSDETNLVVCSLAANFGAKRRIARVRNTALSQTIQQFGFSKFYIDEIINPEEVAAQSIIKTIETPGASEVADFAQGQILLRSFDVKANSPLNGQRMEELRVEDFPWPFLIVAVTRDGKVTIPQGKTTINAGDRIYALLPAPSLGEFLTFVDPEIRLPRKIVIYGAGDIGERVARSLSRNIRDITLIEEDVGLAEAIAGRLESVRIINGSASSTEILTECGIEAADAFVAATGNDHSNLVSAVLAKKMGAKTTIITTQQPDYMSIVDVLDIDAIINPRLLAADQILRVVRGKGIRSVTQLIEGDAEALELIPEDGAPITQSPLKDIHFPKDCIVGAVYRGSEVILAKGDTQIRSGDRVIAFCQEAAAKKLQALFTRRKILAF